ncbi:MAG: Fic family protein [Candidatus Dadabacteria bacterium]|nr:Fic family protein [Candidatus Dadabacteria bacterium]MDE0520034.1 Fic family protein [Candidatus Dadabacteria bacterium]MDE0663861.1 Fic family protein [Candidatus Dadabacteria bacterium]
MRWNWQRPEWPDFTYEPELLEGSEHDFLRGTGLLFGAYMHLDEQERDLLRVEIIGDEALKTSEIEGEYLDRESLQSSLRRHFGLQTDDRKVSSAEAGITDLMVDLYGTYEGTLSHETLYRWHRMLTLGRTDLRCVGCYREHGVEVVSGPLHRRRIHFEAPPQQRVKREMDGFVRWFNRSAPGAATPLPALTRAGTAHLYFECIHPFEDGNGRIGRAVSEKALAQSLGHPTLIALATVISRNRKAYYGALGEANTKNEITGWLCYFARTVLDALSYTRIYVEFLIKKAKLLERMRGKMNPRQEKCLLRMFEEGPEGFAGGLSAENYISITKATRPTATRDLSDLVAKGALARTGERKSTRYHLNIDLRI